MWFGQLTTHIPGILVHLHKGNKYRLYTEVKVHC